MKTLRFAILASTMLFAGCAAKQEVHKEKLVGLPVTLPLEMCAEQGKIAVSKGKEGERMICERTAPIGTHLPYCICRDEGLIAAQNEETQQLIRTMEKNVQLKK